MEKIKRGTVREDGKIFVRRSKYKGRFYEWWATPEAFESYLGKQRICSENHRSKMTDEEKRDFYAYQNSRPSRHFWLTQNKEKLRSSYRKWLSENREESNRWRREWIKDKGPHFRMALNVRSRISFALRTKTESSVTYLGCSMRDLAFHLESQFTEGMSWENYGKSGWHVDHRIPIASAKTKEEMILLLHFSNLQPLWAKDNLSKGCRIL